MKSKIINVFIILGLAVNTLSPLSVFAKEENSPSMEMDYIEQSYRNPETGYYSHQHLELVDGMYSAVSPYGTLSVHLKFNNFQEGKKYKVCVDYGNGCGFVDFDNQEIHSFYIPLTRDIVSKEYVLYECINDDCKGVNSVLLDTLKVRVKNDFYDEMVYKKSKIVIDSMESDGEPITDRRGTEVYNHYNVYQGSLVKVKFHGENLAEDLYYTVNFGPNNGIEVKGSDLNKGMEVEYRLEDSSIGFDVYSFNNQFLKIYFPEYASSVGITVYFYQKNLVDINMLYKSQNKYTNFEFGHLASDEYSKNNPVSIYLKDRKADTSISREMEINFSVSKYSEEKGWYSEVVYSKNIEVSGKDIKKGVVVPFDDFVPEYTEGNYGSYDVQVKDGNNEYISWFVYKKTGELDGRMFYTSSPNSIFAFSSSGWTDGNPDFYGVGGELNRSELEKNGGVYIYYLGKNFVSSKKYNFGLKVCDNWDWKDAASCTTKKLNDGVIYGDILNNAGLLVKVNKDDLIDLGEQQSFLILTVYDGDQIVHSLVYGYKMVDTPTITSFKLSTNDRSYYATIQRERYDFGTYLVNKNTSMVAKLTGIDFDENKDYRFCIYKKSSDVVQEYYTYEDKEDYLIEEKIVKGKDINNGNVTFDLNYSSGSLKDVVTIDIYDDYEYIVGGSVNIEYLNPSDFFKESFKNKIDNNLSLIKGILKNTTVKDFVDNTDILAKIYKNDILLAEDEKVGTGMVATVFDDLDRKLYDMDIVVTGDVNGDGDVSITDLVKVKQHLAGVRELEGVYKTAGDISETGDIGITDLVKVSRDVSGLENLK